jgi:methionyl aminopeptidase
MWRRLLILNQDLKEYKMKVNIKEPFDMNGFFLLHNNEFLENQRIAGKVVSKCLQHLDNRIKEKTLLTAKQLSLEVEQIIFDSNCIPTFKGYKSFPESCCISINNQLVHGIPQDIPFKDGDIVSFDLGATYNGAIGDAAITCIYGENPLYEKMIRVTKECIDKAIQYIAVDKKIGVIGNAIFKHAKDNGFNVIETYGGHAIGMSEDGYGIPHAAPFISNKSKPDEGIRIQPGMSLCIEPMLLIGDNKTYVSHDGWTVMTKSIGCHFERTIFIHEDRVEVITMY